MRLLIYTTLPLLVILSSCADTGAPGKVPPSLQTHGWEVLRIRIDNQSISVPAEQDTCYSAEFFDDTTYARQHDGRRRVEHTKFIVKQPLRDSLFLLAEHTVQHHRETDQHVSCYAGQYFKLVLEQDNSSISCSYSSIASWTGISPDMAAINRILFPRIRAAAATHQPAR